MMFGPWTEKVGPFDEEIDQLTEKLMALRERWHFNERDTDN